ncbi:type II toxin-antitoxin system RelE/ParE family toxin [Chryseobacterium koreense]|uniref:type II toxin-antitoxin system RelE/ParE family toxin n=1 Tax=Chryseobacterium koreense TaxID=232216 RepID=UPI0017A7CE6D|nr:type II toxin-antitoxin system RelE/ParE family toxin [Chryseobacterium koreense]MBB5332567.1 plasmid stabilization system protein ParE [Chryseobacterium koreense]
MKKTIAYLEQNFTENEIIKLVRKIESITELISQNPNLFPKSEIIDVHKAVILKYNSRYYRVKNENVEILSFFSNRQSPKKRKI